MKQTILASVLALAMAAAPAVAQTKQAAPVPAGCATEGIHLFDEDVNGNNCPPTKAENALGWVVAISLIGIVAAHVNGHNIFPLGPR